MPSTIQVLKDAREILANNTWGQGVDARDAQGRMTDPHDPSATCFCSYGALVRACGPKNFTDEAYTTLQQEIVKDGYRDEFGTMLTRWNDTVGRTRGEVLDLFDKAIATAEATS